MGAMGAVEAQQERAGFYAVMAGLALAAALAGSAAIFFSTQAPLRAPFAVYGAFAGAWCALAVSMARVKRARRRADIAFAAAAFAAAMAYALPRCAVAMAGLAAKIGDAAYPPFLSVLAATVLFVACAAAAVFNQDRADAYRRFMLLAGAALLWPLWMRLSLDFADAGSVVRFAPLAADLAIAVAMVRDRIVLKTVHPVYARMGAVIVAAHVLEVIAYDSAPWRAAAQAVYAVLAG